MISSKGTRNWAYFSERLVGPQRDRVNMIVAQLDNPSDGGRVAQAIDAHFGEHDDQTTSEEDRAVIAQLVERFGSILEALDLISWLVLGVVLLILGNTVAMGVRERVKEYGTLRALGFQGGHIIGFVLGESAALGVVGGVLCLALSYPLVELALARFLQEQAGFPAIHLSPDVALGTIGLGVALSALAAGISARGMMRRDIVECLRKVG